MSFQCKQLRSLPKERNHIYNVLIQWLHPEVLRSRTYLVTHLNSCCCTESCGQHQISHKWSIDGPSAEEALLPEPILEGGRPSMHATSSRFILLEPQNQRTDDLLRNDTDRMTTATTTIGPPRPHKMRRSERLTLPQGNSVNALLESATNVLGTLSQRTTSQPDDIEEAYGKYVAQRLRGIQSEQDRAAIIFEIDKIFYEYSKK